MAANLTLRSVASTFATLSSAPPLSCGSTGSTPAPSLSLSSPSPGPPTVASATYSPDAGCELATLADGGSAGIASREDEGRRPAAEAEGEGLGTWQIRAVRTPVAIATWFET